MKRLILILLLLAAIVFATKFYVEYRYSRELSQHFLLLSSQVALSHDRVSLEWDGSLIAHQVRARPIDYDLAIAIDQVKIQSPQVFRTLLDIYRLEQGTIDGQFDLSFKGVSVAGAMLEEAKPDQECRSFGSMFNFHAMDMVPYKANTRLNVDLTGSDEVAIRYDIIDPLGNYRGRVEIDKADFESLMRAETTPTLSKANIRARLNPSKAAQMLQYCADLFSVSSDDYVQKVMASNQYSNNSFAMEIGTQARFALASFLRGDSELTARFKGLGAIDKWSFDAMPKSVWRKVDITLDDTPIALELPEAKKMEVVITREEIQRLDNLQPRKRQFIESDLDSAEQFIKRRVRITRTDGRKRIEGRLIAVNDDVLTVKMNHDRGEIVLGVNYDDIDQFSVREK